MGEELKSLAPDLGSWEVLKNALNIATVIAAAEARGEHFAFYNPELGYQVSAISLGDRTLTVSITRLDGKPFYHPATKYPGPEGITPMLSSWTELHLTPDTADNDIVAPPKRGKK